MSNDENMSPVLLQWFARARELRAEFQRSEGRFFQHLFVGDTELEEHWRGQYGSFGELLDKTGLASSGRYASFRRAVDDGVPVKRVIEMGVDAFAVSARLTPPQRTEYESVVHAWSKQHDGVTPSREVAVRFARDITGPGTKLPSRSIRTQRELEIENTALRRENERLKRDNERMRKEIGKLKLAKTKKAA